MIKSIKIEENSKIWLKVTPKKSDAIGLTKKSTFRAFASQAKNWGRGLGDKHQGGWGLRMYQNINQRPQKTSESWYLREI